MTPVSCVQAFAFWLGVPSGFLLGVVSWNYWILSPVHGKSQMSLPGTIFLKLTIRVWVCRPPRLKYSLSREIQGTAGQRCLTRGLPLMTWNSPLWSFFPFLGRRNQRYSPYWKICIVTRYSRRSQNLPEAFPSGQHPSNQQKMCR